MTDHSLPEMGGSEKTDGFKIYKEGMIFRPLDKKIHKLIVVATEYIVFLDPELHVHYYDEFEESRESPKLPQGCGDVFGREADLETASRLLLTGSPQTLEAACTLLGEAIARLYADESVVYANKMLDKAAEFLRARSAERARLWYLKAVLTTTIIILAGALIFWKIQGYVLSFFGFGHGFLEAFLGAAMGSVGASISVLLRSNRLEIDASAGRPVHYFEGSIRVLLGALAGLLLVLAFKSNLVLGVINSTDRTINLLLTLAIFAGASERVLPNLINQITDVLVGKKPADSVAKTGTPQHDKPRKETQENNSSENEGSPPGGPKDDCREKR